jgi:hypothetical protein
MTLLEHTGRGPIFTTSAMNNIVHTDNSIFSLANVFFLSK